MENSPRIAQSDIGPRLPVFRQKLEMLRFPFGNSDDSQQRQAEMIHQLDDYVIPRYASLEAPLLAVFGGSTGSGKSTLVNSILGQTVAQASAIRPTTRRPILVHHPQDASWFTSQRIFPTLARVSAHGSYGHKPDDAAKRDPSEHEELEVCPSPAMPQGLAVVDSPDIDSVVVENRQLAGQLLAAADLWVFVTTAARYADAIPWAVLDDAVNRHVVIAVVLNRVPTESAEQVHSDLQRMLAERGLREVPLFMVYEQPLDGQQMLPDSAVEPIRSWLGGLAADAQKRATVARQTLYGTVDSLITSAHHLSAAYREQIAGMEAMRGEVDSAFRAAREQISAEVSDGSMLRGEVLSRWQDVVGTGEWARKLEKGVSRLRDKMTGFFRAKVDTAPLEVAIEDNLHSLILGHTHAAHTRLTQSWNHGVPAEIARDVARDLPDEAQRRERSEQLVRQWQESLIQMIRAEGQGKKFTARALAFSVNAIGVALIIVVFASTGGLVGGEIAVAGGTAVVAQRVLEAVFGDDAVRRMARAARANLDERVAQFLDQESEPYLRAIAKLAVNTQISAEFEQAVRDLACARAEQRV
ncbi:dynamin family protein [Trueperella sp. LYQ141]|uniref:dynamin family protein n=1 Tax=Trueperella sp. LYQ141 TaxID=3391058 RepID=UPI0039832138